MASESAVSSSIKNSAIFTFGAYAIGLVARRAWDASLNLPSFVDEPIFDIEMLIFGLVTLFPIIWSMVFIKGLRDIDIRNKAIAHWEKVKKPEEGRAPKLWLILYSALYFPKTQLFVFITTPIMVLFNAGGGFDRQTISLVILAFNGTLLSYLLYRMGQKRMVKESNAPTEVLSDALGIENEFGKSIATICFFSIFLGIAYFPLVAQRFGGGKSIKVIVFLKKDSSALLPSQQNIEGRLINLVFRRGSKFGFKADGWRNDHILVIDQDKIDRLYVGSKVFQLDPQKLQVQK